MSEDLGVAFGDEAEYGRDGEEGGEGDSDNLFVSEIHVDGKKSNDDNAPAGQIGQCETKGETLGIAVKAGETPSFRLPQWGQPVF